MTMQSLALLSGYLESQKEQINRLVAETRGCEPEGKEKTVYLGYLLHNLYCAIEDLFKQIAATFENQVDDPSTYHRELLKKMTIEVPGVRPAVISRERLPALDELRGFRHVYRHAYMYELDPERIRSMKAKVLAGWVWVEDDINRFGKFLKDTIGQ